MAVGNAAKEMIGRTPKLVRAYRPLQEGVIADFETTKTMLQYQEGNSVVFLLRTERHCKRAVSGHG